ncbi:MAG: hypothetical protein HN995_11705 [Candidatus Marinimicrobia bacterium]|jgi:hypothetical protein|nr:hypothetical protein [Candidatus Neomarinimicrobiota bacterium]MBT3575104.1 hypothetical protein [Candidatus Neomarinimicrobiota bacterium]MBT3678876.1 hypothetical protein [Candidatus Neomarinimicrobiota bacterium]MBT3949990.1 hypothetical protein [Candidatus Neomarinimicrobiota bacterium]MBT4252693.1 hypothetical protein [Candidatus Neomarinimicrobiota bacterium]
MRKSLISLFAVLVITTGAFGQNTGLGIGLSTDGLSAKYWMGSSNAVAVTWNFGTSVAADYLFDKPDMLNLTDATTPVYYGAGLSLGTHKGINDDLEETTEFDLGVRGVIGIGYYLSAYPVDIFIESTPTLKLLGGGGFGFGGSLGIRYFF